jgi:hypothetical protein
MRLMALPSSALNPFVAGSIPARPTRKKASRFRGVFSFAKNVNGFVE